MIAFLVPVPFMLTMLYALLARRGKNRHVGYIGSIAGLLTVILAWLSYGTQASVSWFSVSSFDFEISVMVDPLSLLLAGIVGFIGIFVFLYSVGYLQKGEDLRRYYALLSLFAWSMVAMVLARNLFALFFFWELVGVSSFLLIGFWHERPSAMRAARKAFLTIITGDALFLAGILMIGVSYGTFDIPEILSALQPNAMTLLGGIGIMVGAISKSAQFPLHGWLADAMEGPTPVSAFLHSATMVKAGLYLIARFLPLLVIAGLSEWLVAIAVMTILVSGTIALVENDIKRVLAYSTMNQLGFILLAIAAGSMTAGLYHLLTHSIFKALLFFVAGIAIHAAGTQDMRRMEMKLGWNMFTISALAGVAALAGVLPFSGFFSKEAIFEGLIAEGRYELIGLFALAIVLSSAYIFRWFFMVFSLQGRPAGKNWQMNFPLPVLGLLALAGGVAMTSFFGFFNTQAPHVFGITTVVSLSLVLLGFLAAWVIYYVHADIGWLSRSVLAEFFRSKWMIDEVYSAACRSIMWLARFFSWIDNAIINRTVRLFSGFPVWLGIGLRRVQTGFARTYLVLFILGFVLIALILGVLA